MFSWANVYRVTGGYMIMRKYRRTWSNKDVR